MMVKRVCDLFVRNYSSHAAGTATRTTTSTSTKIIATNTITITRTATGPTPIIPSAYTSPDVRIAVFDFTSSSRTDRATSTVTYTTTISMAPGSLESIVLNSTNYYRSQHLADAVQWNNTLAEYAKDWAQGCVWKHSGGPYGENLAAGFENATLGIDAWGNEEKKYNYAKAKFTEENGHFTQLVWQDTTDVGCAMVDCGDGGKGGVQGQYLVCEYSPRGNVQGQFKYNVRKPGISEDGTLGLGSTAAQTRSKKGITVLALVFVVGGVLQRS